MGSCHEQNRSHKPPIRSILQYAALFLFLIKPDWGKPNSYARISNRRRISIGKWGQIKLCEPSRNDDLAARN